jgi:hypothetical protein
MKTGRRVRHGCSLSPILFNLYSEYLTNEALEGFGNFKIGQVICTVKYADDLVLLAKEETVLQHMIDGLTEIVRCCAMEMIISRELSRLQIVTDQKQREDVEYFNYLGSMVTNNARRTREIKCRTDMAQAAFNRKKTIFNSKLDLNLRKKPVNCCI